MGTRAWVAVALGAWAAAIGLWLARAYFILPPDLMPFNHERHHYVYRLVEFRDLLGAGYWSPQWATHFRGGLGGPYFGYYQPGFFYLASLVPWSVDPMRALGCVVIAALVFGFATTFALIRSRFGGVAGFVGATAFIAAPYPRVEILVRGDLSEFTAMMLVPFVLHRFLDALERGRTRDLVGLAVGFAAVLCTHPAVGLFLAIALAVALPVLVAANRGWAGGLRAGTALAVGVGLVGFYALPVAFEIGYVAADKAFRIPWRYIDWFVEPLDVFDPAARRPFPIVVGDILVVMAALNLAWFLWRPRAWAAEQRRLLGCALAVSAVMLFLMSSASAPLWALVPPLPKVQFPGRALAVLTPALACAAGAIGGETGRRWRHAALVLLALASAAQSVSAMTPGAPVPFVHVTRATDLVTAQNFAPDVADEWLPRNAIIRSLVGLPTGPSVSWGKCSTSDFVREQGRLAVRVADNPQGCRVTLPHYFFPLGWQASIDGATRGLTLGQFGGGLMQVGVPPGVEGTVELRFRMTPMRRLGWLLSAVAGTLGLLALAWMGGRLGRRAP